MRSLGAVLAAVNDEPQHYRIEHRHPDLAAPIVGFAGSLGVAHVLVARHRRRVRQRGEVGVLVIVGQETGADVRVLPVVGRRPTTYRPRQVVRR